MILSSFSISFFWDPRVCLKQTLVLGLFNYERPSSPFLFGLSKAIYKDKEKSPDEHEVKTEYLGKDF